MNASATVELKSEAIKVSKLLTQEGAEPLQSPFGELAEVQTVKGIGDAANQMTAGESSKEISSRLIDRPTRFGELKQGQGQQDALELPTAPPTTPTELVRDTKEKIAAETNNAMQHHPTMPSLLASSAFGIAPMAASDVRQLIDEGQSSAFPMDEGERDNPVYQPLLIAQQSALVAKQNRRLRIMLGGVFQVLSRNKLEHLSSCKFVVDNALSLGWSVLDIRPLASTFVNFFTLLEDGEIAAFKTPMPCFSGKSLIS
ncbi:hypothetical protein MRB53_013877 [Persea americana]|uniref:Uncharacterized protein n=1 Tax=Persea americana TaxID=3435 RepID=A0ACC2K9L3_PERAE|nr:hypothetical protein MRB53_013877 [Persea americana]